MPVYGREDDLVIALQEATKALTSQGRFEEISNYEDEVAAANKVTEIADVYVAWLRRVKSVKLTLVRIEEMDDPNVFTPGGGVGVTTIDSSQQARYVIDAADDRGWAVDAQLTVEATPAGIVEATLFEATSGTASGKDELVVKAMAPGSALVTVFDAANAETVFGSDSVDVVPGGVATVVLNTPTIEEQEPAAPPVP